MNSYSDNLNALVLNLILSEQSNVRVLTKELAQYPSFESKESWINFSGQGEQNKLHQRDATSLQLMGRDGDVAIICSNLKGYSNEVTIKMNESLALTSIATANFQTAANSILKLASDFHSAFSIINAADFDSNMLLESRPLLSMLSEITDLSEDISQHVMNLSSLFAALEFKRIHVQIDTLNKIVQASFEASSSSFFKGTNSEQVEAKISELMERAEAKEKHLKMAAQLNAAVANLEVVNASLNLDLKVRTKKEFAETSNSETSSNILSVSFHPLQHPFTSSVKDEATEIVKSYCGIFVKSEKKSTFSLTEAEELISRRLVDNGYTQLENLEKRNNGIFSAELNLSEQQDAEGNNLDVKSTYVLFIYAEYTVPYKKQLNNFEDYLSAPSSVFYGNGSIQDQAILTDLHQLGFDATELEKLQFKSLPQKKEEVSQLIEVLGENNDSFTKEFLIAVESFLNVTQKTTTLVSKLIFTANCLNKLSTLIVKQKALNPLISNELIELLSVLATDTNSSVANSLSALNAIYQAKQSVILAKENVSLQNRSIAELEKQVK